MRSLYVTQTGMAENLGQSQVLPYLRGLSRRGVRVQLISYELATLAADTRASIAARMVEDGIDWRPLVRQMPGSLPVKVRESALGVATALRAGVLHHPDVVHGRSYLATAICDATAAVSRGARLLFDCRGMLGDEYVDAGYWTTERREYKLLKRYERRLFQRSDGIVVLTRALRDWLKANALVGTRPTLEVIPCCVDLERFKPDAAARVRLRAELGLGDAFTLLYSGSLGSWYLERDMARFAKMVRAMLGERRTVFVCFSPSDATAMRSALDEVGFPAADVVVKKLAPKDIAAYLCVGDVGISFIQSCFSKKGSSPTKVAEYLACGNIAVVNGDIGDQADLASEPQSCVVLADWSDAEMENAARAAVALASRPFEERGADTAATARRHFGLEEVGIARYARLYETLARS